MLPKCSLDVRNTVTLREHSANIPGILRTCWRFGHKQKAAFVTVLVKDKKLSIHFGFGEDKTKLILFSKTKFL